MPESVKRRYDSTRRREQAAETRRQIVEASRSLFVDQGYVNTSMREVADASGVSLQTLYNAFDSKFGLFAALMDVVVAGDHAPVAIRDRPEVQAIENIKDPSDYLAAVVNVAVPILVRLSVIYPTLRAAAASDPDVERAYRQFAIDARYQPHRKAGRRLARLGALADGVSARMAADALWTILSPDTYHLLVDERGWTSARFAEWALHTLRASLLGPPA